MAESSFSKKRLIVVAVFYLILVVVLSLIAAPHIRKLGEAGFREAFGSWVRSAGFAGVLAVLGLQIAQVVIAFIPGEPVEILCGAMYGGFGGLLLCLAGWALASLAVFFMVRKFGSRFLTGFAGGAHLENFAFFKDSERLELAAFILFLLPGTPKDALTYVAALSRISPRRFLLISCFARIPSIITSTYAGATMRQGNFLASAVLFASVGLIGLAGFIWKDRLLNFTRKIGKKNGSCENEKNNSGQKPSQPPSS